MWSPRSARNSPPSTTFRPNMRLLLATAEPPSSGTWRPSPWWRSAPRQAFTASSRRNSPRSCKELPSSQIRQFSRPRPASSPCRKLWERSTHMRGLTTRPPPGSSPRSVDRMRLTRIPWSSSMPRQLLAELLQTWRRLTPITSHRRKTCPRTAGCGSQFCHQQRSNARND